MPIPSQDKLGRAKKRSDSPEYGRGWSDAAAAAIAACQDEAAYARHMDDCEEAEALADFALRLKNLLK